MKTKTFDAIEMKRHGSKKIYEATAHMTPEQQRAFWQQRTEALKKRQQAIQRKQHAA